MALSGRQIVLRELVMEAVEGNCSHEKKGKKRLKNSDERHQDLRVEEEGGAAAKRT